MEENKVRYCFIKPCVYQEDLKNNWQGCELVKKQKIFECILHDNSSNFYKLLGNFIGKLEQQYASFYQHEIVFIKSTDIEKYKKLLKDSYD